MNRKNFRIAALLTLLLAALHTLGLAEMTSVTVFTHVENAGQTLDEMRMVADDLPTLAPEDFSLYAEIRWRDEHFTLSPDEVVLYPDGIGLRFSALPETWNEVGWWRVRCRDARFSFTRDDATTQTAVVDDFVQHAMYRADWSPTGDAFDYALFSPQHAAEPLPLVLVLHGSTDWGILTSGRQATCWAEPAFQEEHPCFVLVPFFQDVTTLSNDEVLEAALALIREMIAAGQADASRIYVTGLSMGGWNGLTLLTRYSETPFFAAALLYCPWLDRRITEDELRRALDTPLWILYGERDPYIPDPGEAVDRLIALGGAKAQKTIYPAEAFEAMGIESQHAVDMLALADRQTQEWLFAHRLSP